MKQSKHFWRMSLLALAICLPMAVTEATAAGIQVEADGTAVSVPYEAEESPTISLLSTEEQVEQNGVLYSLSGVEAAAVGYTKDIASACAIPSSITVDGVAYSVTSIANSAFYNCANLVTVNLPASVTSIGEKAFAGCVRLTGINIPAGVTVIGSQAFTDCSVLTAITVDAGNTVYNSKDGVLFEGTILLQYPLGRTDTSYAAPDGTTEIGDYAFYRAAKLHTVTLPDTVTTIGSYAFSYCNDLQNIDLGTGLQKLNSNGFYYCSSLTALSLPASIQYVGQNCFLGADSLTAIEVAEGCERYFDDSGVLYGYGMPSTSTSDDLVLYAYPAGSARTSYTVLDGTKIILGAAFWDAKQLTAVQLPETLTSIEFGAFTGCGLTAVTVPDSVTELGSHVFQSCTKLVDVSLGAGVTELSSGLFYNCDSLTTFTLPKQIVSIADDAFDGCDSLEAYEVEEGSETYSAYSGALYNATQTELLVYPATRRDAEAELPATVEKVSYGAFADCKFLQRITVAEGNEAYYDVDGVLFERTGEQTVNGTTVNFGVSLHTYPLGRTASSYTVPDGVQTIAERAFIRNTALTELDLNEVAYVREQAFFFCTNLERVTGEKLVALERNAFFRNDNLAHITLPETLASLGIQCLDYCYSLEYIEFLNETPPTLMNHGSAGTCMGASGLRYVYVPVGTSVAYKEALSGELYPGAMIVEGRYVPEVTLAGQIEALTEESPVTDVNAAAAGIVRLLSSEIDDLSDDQLVKVDELFQAAHEDTLTVTVSSTSGNVAVQGAAVASGLVETQAADGTVSGTVAIEASEQPTAVGELLNLDFTMAVNGTETELQAPVLVEVTLPESLRDQEFLLVHRDGAGEETPVDYTQNGDTVSFRANSFSSYVFLATGVSYMAEQDGTLFLATYDLNGRMLSIQAMDVAAGESGNFQLQPEQNVRYRAFVLDENCAPTGGAVVRFP